MQVTKPQLLEHRSNFRTLRHLEGILGHWKEGLTTAFLEGLNSLFSATKRKARGYRTQESPGHALLCRRQATDSMLL